MNKSENYKEFEKAVRLLDDDEPYDTHAKLFDYRDMQCAFKDGSMNMFWKLIPFILTLIGGIIYASTK